MYERLNKTRSQISFTQMFEGAGIYQEDGHKALLAVFSGPPFPKTFTIDEALQNKAASFVYTKKELKQEDAGSFLDRCRGLLDMHGAGRGILWLGEDTSLACAVDDSFHMLRRTFRATVSGTSENGITVKIGTDTAFDHSMGTLIFSDASSFSFGELHLHMQVQKLCLHLCGEQAGTLETVIKGSGEAFADVFACGFEYGFLDQKQQNCLISGRLFDRSSLVQQDLNLRFSFGFHIFSNNRISFLESGTSVRIRSNYTTVYGDRIWLVPVTDEAKPGGMAFLPRISEHVNCAPYGKYRLQTDRGKDIHLLCGLSGTEVIVMAQNGLLEFYEGQAAFSAYYPQKGISISDFAAIQPEHLLSGELVTAGASFYGSYHAQPLKAPFFTGNGSLLSLADICMDFSNGSPAVPLMPYADIRIHAEGSKDPWANGLQISEYETQILMAERSICMQHAYNSGHIQSHMARAGANADTVRAATPSGFVGELAGQMLTAVTAAFSPGGNLRFSHISDALRSAFLDASMFCVMIDASGAGTFQNRFSIGSWQFTISPGDGSTRNDYANVLLIKYAKGKLYDPDNETAGLCANTSLWTCRDNFAAPKEGTAANLAAWMLNYCKNAYDSYKDGDQDYAHFAGILTDADWKGILMLNVTVDPSAFPDCLKPLISGSGDISSIPAHHIGTELVPLKAAQGGPVPEGNSPFFGLIHYMADGFTGTALPPADPAAVYEFRLLELKTVFENGAVKQFHSISQLVLGELMALKPSPESCPYNALLLNGSVQDTGGHSALVMDTEGGCFQFQKAPVSAVTVTGITMETVNAEKSEYTFRISGRIAFQPPAKDASFDLFSYDELFFTDYCLLLSDNAFYTDTGPMKFDLSHSVLRKQSLCQYFCMSAVSMRIDAALTDSYPAVAAQNCGTSSSLELPAAGIVFSIKLGGLGSLVPGAALTAELLLAWDSQGSRYIGLKLPGSSVIDGVLGVSFSNAMLMAREGKPVLYLPKTALQLFGLPVLPPNGSFTLAMEGNGKGIGWFGAIEGKEGTADVPL